MAPAISGCSTRAVPGRWHAVDITSAELDFGRHSGLGNSCTRFAVTLLDHLLLQRSEMSHSSFPIAQNRPARVDGEQADHPEWVGFTFGDPRQKWLNIHSTSVDILVRATADRHSVCTPSFPAFLSGVVSAIGLVSRNAGPFSRLKHAQDVESLKEITEHLRSRLKHRPLLR